MQQSFIKALFGKRASVVFFLLTIRSFYLCSIELMCDIRTMSPIATQLRQQPRALSKSSERSRFTSDHNLVPNMIRFSDRHRSPCPQSTGSIFTKPMCTSSPLYSPWHIISVVVHGNADFSKRFLASPTAPMGITNTG